MTFDCWNLNNWGVWHLSSFAFQSIHSWDSHVEFCWASAENQIECFGPEYWNLVLSSSHRISLTQILPLLASGKEIAFNKSCFVGGFRDIFPTFLQSFSILETALQPTYLAWKCCCWLIPCRVSYPVWESSPCCTGWRISFGCWFFQARRDISCADFAALHTCDSEPFSSYYVDSLESATHFQCFK